MLRDCGFGNIIKERRLISCNLLKVNHFAFTCEHPLFFLRLECSSVPRHNRVSSEVLGSEYFECRHIISGIPSCRLLIL
jgi:hypothetical protein